MTHTLTHEGHDASEDGTGRGTPIVAVSDLGQGQRIRSIDEPSETLRATKRGPFSDYYVQPLDTIVRRLTELECERLQGYPDGWTDGQTASARYRQLGNSVAVPCVEWIARRLIATDGEVTA